MSQQKIIIIGAGLAGSLLAIYLAKRGVAVEVYEARGDMRRTEVAAGRSINLALSDRGIAALREVGMDKYMLNEAVPMLGRMIHTPAGDTKLLPYSGRKGEYINSVSRAGLNVALIDEAEKYRNVKFYFNERCTAFDCGVGDAVVENTATGKKRIIKGDTLIATDGAGSAVRDAMQRDVPGFALSQEFLEHGYKELHIPPGAGGEFQLEKNALHIWPRHKFMMIALPNFDGSFTCTLFLAQEGENSFAGISQNCLRERAVETDEKLPADGGSSDISAFFNSQFPDALDLMPGLEQDFAENPVGSLGTVKCFPWHVGGRALLLGDAAHALVPFYGQGMNCAFEDCRVLDQLIEAHGMDWKFIFEKFQDARKVNTDAIADMAEENFYEMRDATADPVFQRKRELETKLEQAYPDYFSKYSMVTFREDLPYSIAKQRGNMQDKLLMEICAGVESVGELSLDEVMEQMRACNNGPVPGTQ